LSEALCGDWTDSAYARIGYGPGGAIILIIVCNGRILHRSGGPPFPESTAKSTTALNKGDPPGTLKATNAC
jgi:hypothetical protein